MDKPFIRRGTIYGNFVDDDFLGEEPYMVTSLMMIFYLKNNFFLCHNINITFVDDFLGE